MAHSLHINLNSANTLIPRTIETDNLLDQVPISVITFECRQLICSQLNRKKILLSPEGLPRDWRGVLQCIQLRNVTARDFINEKDPFGRVFDHWLRKEGNTATLSNFQAILKRIDRFDTFHDTRQYFEQFAKEYVDKKAQCQKESARLDQRERNIVTTRNDVTAVEDYEIITFEDQQLAELSLPPQKYDAFVLFAEEDMDFVNQLINRLEQQYLKICTEDSLVPGVTQLNAIEKLIANRCNRLIVVYSPAFYCSESNKSYTQFAQAIGMEQSRRKILPILYKQCDLPTGESIRYLVPLNYLRLSENMFWERLISTLTTSSTIRTPPAIMPTKTIQSPLQKLLPTTKSIKRIEQRKQGDIDATLMLLPDVPTADPQPDDDNNSCISSQSITTVHSNSTVSKWWKKLYKSKAKAYNA